MRMLETTINQGKITTMHCNDKIHFLGHYFYLLPLEADYICDVPLWRDGHVLKMISILVTTIITYICPNFYKQCVAYYIYTNLGTFWCPF